MNNFNQTDADGYCQIYVNCADDLPTLIGHLAELLRGFTTRQTVNTSYIGMVGHTLQNFWDRGWDAVAACDFEFELPRSGGYYAGEILGRGTTPE